MDLTTNCPGALYSTMTFKLSITTFPFTNRGRRVQPHAHHDCLMLQDFKLRAIKSVAPSEPAIIAAEPPDYCSSLARPRPPSTTIVVQVEWCVGQDSCGTVPSHTPPVPSSRGGSHDSSVYHVQSSRAMAINGRHSQSGRPAHLPPSSQPPHGNPACVPRS
ncbi:hypothetical protein BC567DRAFT_229272 [Phyllosticta citribraziliensis]